MLRLSLLAALGAAAFLLLPGVESRADKEDKEKGFVSIFDGKSLKGWRVSAKSGHSGASKHKSGGKWVVEDGAIDRQPGRPPATGASSSPTKHYGNYEIVLEMKNDFGPDSRPVPAQHREGAGVPGDDRLPRRTATSWASTARGMPGNVTDAQLHSSRTR